MFFLRRPLVAAVLAVALGALTLAGCSSAATGTAGAAGPKLVASFYPLQFVLERLAGADDLGVAPNIVNLTQPGAEPHDLELRPQDVATIDDATLVVTLGGGFQPAVDQATKGNDNVFDVAGSANLVKQGDSTDPHFWLDPTRLATVATAVADKLAEVDPDRAETYRSNAISLTAELRSLDGQFKMDLSGCKVKALVTTHAAFGYLARQYGFTQHGITGISPEAEPTAGELASAVAFIKAQHVTTIYNEPLLSSKIVQTVAETAGVQHATLDPLEGLTPQSQGVDYIEVMQANMQTLQVGQECGTTSPTDTVSATP